MIDHHPLKLLHPDGSVSVGHLSGGIVDPQAHRCELTLEHPQLGRQSFTAFDFFRCLRDLRLALEADGILPLCNGARENAFVSGMAAQMGYGLTVYLLTPGIPAGDRSSRAPLLAEAEPHAVVSVAAQDDFQQRYWHQ